MVPKGSLSCSQEPATGSYPKPDESNLHPQILFLQDLLHNNPLSCA
jgi:hypothetical protein